MPDTSQNTERAVYTPTSARLRTDASGDAPIHKTVYTVARPRSGARRGTTSRSGSAPKRKGRVRRFVLKSFCVLFAMIFSVAALAFGAITLICTGPFPNARNLFVVSVEETSAAKFLSRIYFSEEEVQEILSSNAVLPPDDITDVTAPFEPSVADENVQDIEIIEVSGDTFRGKLMIVQDPSRIDLATLSSYGASVQGKRVEDFAAEAGATAAINGGWFDDPGGVGTGGQPVGLLIQDGVVRNNATSTIVGFDNNNRLVVGRMNANEALELGVRDCVGIADNIMPPLIINGTMAEFQGNGSGLNPRTAIGQRADGSVLMLVIDGRQPHSLGASHQDSANIMAEYGAINAAALDGGSSSVMVYEGETINVCASLYGSRTQPAAWLVM